MQEKDNASAKNTKNRPKNGFHIEADKISDGLSFLIYGVTSIRSFSVNEVQLRSGRSEVKVCGSDLSINVYEGRSVEISGRIERVEFI